MANTIDLRKTRTNTQPRVPRAQREIKIPHYYVVNGVVCTNMDSAVEYKRELR